MVELRRNYVAIAFERFLAIRQVAGRASERGQSSSALRYGTTLQTYGAGLSYAPP